MPRREKRLRPPQMLCDGCEEVTQHDMEIVNRGGSLASRTVCKQCGLEKIGGQIATRPKA
jgi:hypothetical protein